MSKRLTGCPVCKRAYAPSRKGQVYCSDKCRDRNKYLASLAGNDLGSGSTTRVVGSPDTKLSLRLNLKVSHARCGICGGETGQYLVDSMTPVFHQDCAEKPDAHMADRTYLFPEVYSPNPTASIFGKPLGGNIAFK